MAFQLTLPPLKLSALPSDEDILSAANELLASTNSWKQRKLYKKIQVQTLWRQKDGPGGHPWHCRVSEHSEKDATFDAMWDKLGPKGPLNEPKYIPSLRKSTLVKRISPTQEIWTMYYTFMPPVSPRVFTVLRFSHLTESSPKTAIVVQIPLDLSEDKDLAALEERGVRGGYVSAERFLQLENGKTEWRMAVSSAPGGRIPSFISELSLPGQIADDVPYFIKWLQKDQSTSDNVDDQNEVSAAQAQSQSSAIPAE